MIYFKHFQTICSIWKWKLRRRSWDDQTIGIFWTEICLDVWTIDVLYLLVSWVHICIPGSSKGHQIIYCPFVKFLPLGRISCEGAGNGHFFDYCGQFWISYLLGWSYSTLRKNVSFFWAEIPRIFIKFPIWECGKPNKRNFPFGMILTSHKMMVGMDYRIGFPAWERERERESERVREWMVCDLIVLRIAMISIEHHCLSF